MTNRKNLAVLTTAERNRFKSVIQQLIAEPANRYGKFVAIHGDMSHDMHGGMNMPNMPSSGTQRFLTWHRDYLLQLEKTMQTIDPLSFIPYWDWTKHWKLPTWLRSFKPAVFIPGRGTEQVTRQPNPSSPASAKAARIAALMNIPDFTTFTDTFEMGAHGEVHMAMNGTMSQIRIAPADPVFWMHHCQIDRIWSQWQATHSGQNPILSGAKAIMDPWPETATQLRAISALGYGYV